MPFDWFTKRNSSGEVKPLNSRETLRYPSVIYGWIITGKLAIGSMPKSEEDWLLLENLGIQKRFSCCYPSENIYSPIPSHWQSLEVALPDHRLQEELTPDKLKKALDLALSFIGDENKSEPVYLHCLAGQERSCLMAVGIVCLSTSKNVFEGLDWVRQCYKRAKPLYEHLELLEQVLKLYR